MASTDLLQDHIFQKDEHDSIPLQNLHIDDQYRKEGVRVVLRPVGSGDGKGINIDSPEGSLRCLVLRVELSESGRSSNNSSGSEVRVVAVTQTSLDIKFSLQIQGSSEEGDDQVDCELYYDPLNDDLVLRNTSRIPIEISTLPEAETEQSAQYRLDPMHIKTIGPATWRLSVGGRSILNFRILTRLHPTVESQRLSSTGEGVANRLKRARPSSQETNSIPLASQEKTVPQRGKITHIKNDAVVMFHHPSEQKDLQLTLGVLKPRDVRGHPLTLADNETLDVPGVVGLGHYQITKHSHLASVGLSEVYLAHHSRLGDCIVVKALKTIRPGASGELKRSTINQAESWLREYMTQKQLHHNSIVQLKGGDARYLTLYLEYIPANDLIRAGIWRDAEHYFIGTKDDAFHIWSDIAGALNYMHTQGIEHNDIKPSNILYSKERGAVLCDFGLSCPTGSLQTALGGTPFYIPPEYLIKAVRGKPADVWAFGVTMLYVLGHTALPDARGRPSGGKDLYWQIAEVHSHQKSGIRPNAAQKMRVWLQEIADTKRKFKDKDDPACILRDMLELEPRRRVTAAELAKRLVHEGWSRQHQPKVKSKPGKAAVSNVSPLRSAKDPFYGSTTEEDTSVATSLDGSGL